MTPQPDRVQQVVDAYLEAVDREAPGLVEGLYLTGSVALGDFRPQTSDIDFVAVTSKPPDAAALTALARAHASVRTRFPRPSFDGRYVTWAELAQDPRQTEPGPYVYEGRFHARGQGDCNPVTWLTIARHGVACRGLAPARLTIWSDPSALKAWTLNNYDRYWEPLLRRAHRFPDLWWLTTFTSYGAVWIVSGVCRLHYTLATGDIGSKSDACRYGLRTFPAQWHRALNEALRVREADRAGASMNSALAEIMRDLRFRHARDGGSLYPTLAARRRDVLAFADMVIADARQRFRSS